MPWICPVCVRTTGPELDGVDRGPLRTTLLLRFVAGETPAHGRGQQNRSGSLVMEGVAFVRMYLGKGGGMELTEGAPLYQQRV